MDLRPLNEIDLRCTSVAEHLGFVALADIAKVMGDHDGWIIGGHMVSLHVYRWGLDLFRATQDADLGVRPAVVRTPELTDRLIAIGYRKTAGNRFEKPVENLSSHTDAVRPGAAIDILVPSYTTRARRSRRFGSHLATTEVPGLAGAMQRPAIDVTVNATLLDNTTATIIVRLPDEVGALILKVMARSVRDEDRDALDVWRALEVCAAAKKTQQHHMIAQNAAAMSTSRAYWTRSDYAGATTGTLPTGTGVNIARNAVQLETTFHAGISPSTNDYYPVMDLRLAPSLPGGGRQRLSYSAMGSILDQIEVDLEQIMVDARKRWTDCGGASAFCPPGSSGCPQLAGAAAELPVIPPDDSNNRPDVDVPADDGGLVDDVDLPDNGGGLVD